MVMVMVMLVVEQEGRGRGDWVRVLAMRQRLPVMEIRDLVTRMLIRSCDGSPATGRR